jgi:hypothetical protein
MPLSDIPIGLVPDHFGFRKLPRPSANAKPMTRETSAPPPPSAPLAPTAEAKPTLASAALATPAVGAPSATEVTGHAEPAAPASTWADLIAAAKRRYAVPATEPSEPPATQDRIAATENSTAENSADLGFAELDPEPASQHREVTREANGAPPLPRPAVPLQASGAERSRWRHACNWLALFRLCRHARCRHAGRCRGEPMACLRTGVEHAPDTVRQFVISMMQAQDMGVSFEEAFEETTDYHDAYLAWVAALQAAQRNERKSSRRARATHVDRARN